MARMSVGFDTSKNMMSSSEDPNYILSYVLGSMECLHWPFCTPKSLYKPAQYLIKHMYLLQAQSWLN